MYKRYLDDFPVSPIANVWTDTEMAGIAAIKLYVVQTNEKVIERCLLMTTDPGDLVLDPDLRLGHYGFRSREMGTSLDHLRHLARGDDAGEATADDSELRLL